MKKLLLLSLFFSFSFGWLQFQNTSAHSGKTEIVAQAETLLWVRQVPSLSPLSGSAIKDSLIFLPTSNGLYCFNFRGESLWAMPGSFGNVPAIIGDSNLIVTSNIFLRAFTLSGESLWQKSFQNQIWHPVVWDSFIFITEGNQLWKLRLNGDTVWSRSCSPGFYNAAPAIDDSGRIFVVTLGSALGYYAFRIYGFNQNGQQIFFHEEWTISEPGGNRVTPTITPSGVILATYPQSGWFNGCYLVRFTGSRIRWEGTMWYSSAAIDASRNRIYHVDGNTIVARDLSGTFVWRSPPLGTISYSSPAIDGQGKIFVGTDLGVFYCLNPDSTIRFQYDTGSGILTHPAIASDGQVIIASTFGRLFCFGPRTVGMIESRLHQRRRIPFSVIYNITGRKILSSQIPLGVYFKIDSCGIRKVVKFH